MCWDTYPRTLGYGFVEPTSLRSPPPVLQLLRPAESRCIFIPHHQRKQYTQRLRGGGIAERPPDTFPLLCILLLDASCGARSVSLWGGLFYCP